MTRNLLIRYTFQWYTVEQGPTSPTNLRHSGALRIVPWTVAREAPDRPLNTPDATDVFFGAASRLAFKAAIATFFSDLLRLDIVRWIDPAI